MAVIVECLYLVFIVKCLFLADCIRQGDIIDSRLYSYGLAMFHLGHHDADIQLAEK